MATYPCLMPTVLQIGAYRFFFYAGDRHEAVHVHVRRDQREAKFWLDAVGLARNRGFTKHELNRVERLVAEHARIVMDTWHDYFAP